MICCEYLRNILIIGFYSILIILELVCTFFIIDNTELIKNVLKDKTFQINCNSDRINTFDNGVLYENTFVFLIMLSIMICMILINIFNYKKNFNINPYQINSYEEESMPLLNVIKIF